MRQDILGNRDMETEIETQKQSGTKNKRPRSPRAVGGGMEIERQDVETRAVHWLTHMARGKW